MIRIDEKLNKIVTENYYTEPDEVLNFRKAVNSADTIEDIEQLIVELSDGVAEDIIKNAFDFAVYNNDEVLSEPVDVVLDNAKTSVIMALDNYLEENDWDGSESVSEAVKDNISDAHKTINFLEEYKPAEELPQWFIDAVEALDWTIHEYENDVELENWSPAGEDLLVYAEKDNLVGSLKANAEYFDEDEHIEMLLHAKANGFAGVPSARELVKDAEEITKMYRELADAVENAAKGNTDMAEAFNDSADSADADDIEILSRYLEVEFPDRCYEMSEILSSKTFKPGPIRRALRDIRTAYNKFENAYDELLHGDL